MKLDGTVRNIGAFLCEDCKLRSYSLRNFPQPPITSSAPGSDLPILQKQAQINDCETVYKLRFFSAFISTAIFFRPSNSSSLSYLSFYCFICVFLYSVSHLVPLKIHRICSLLIKNTPRTELCVNVSVLVIRFFLGMNTMKLITYPIKTSHLHLCYLFHTVYPNVAFH